MQERSCQVGRRLHLKPIPHAGLADAEVLGLGGGSFEKEMDELFEQ